MHDDSLHVAPDAELRPEARDAVCVGAILIAEDSAEGLFLPSDDRQEDGQGRGKQDERGEHAASLQADAEDGHKREEVEGIAADRIGAGRDDLVRLAAADVKRAPRAADDRYDDEDQADEFHRLVDIVASGRVDERQQQRGGSAGYDERELAAALHGAQCATFEFGACHVRHGCSLEMRSAGNCVLLRQICALRGPASKACSKACRDTPAGA
jgi:hypothetical protein